MRGEQLKTATEHSKEKSPLLGRVLWSLVSNALPLAFGLVALPGVVLELGVERFGALSLVWIVMGAGALFDLGLARAATYHMARALGRGARQEVNGVLWTAGLLQVGIATLGALALIGISRVLAIQMLSLEGALAEESIGAFRVLALGLPFILLIGTLRGALEAYGRFDLIGRVKIPSGLALLALSWIGAALGASLVQIVALLVASRVLTLLAYWYYLVGVAPSVRRVRLSRKAFRYLLGFGGWASVSGVAGPIMAWSERLLIGVLLSVSQLGAYSAPVEFLSRLQLLPSSLASVLFPAFSFCGRRGASHVAAIALRANAVLAGVMIPLACLLAVHADRVLVLAFGVEMAESTSGTFRVLCAVVVLNSLAFVPYTVVQAAARPDLKAKLDLVEAPVFLLLCWGGIGAYGIFGAALAKLAITAIDLGALSYFSGRLLSGAGSEGQRSRFWNNVGCATAFGCLVLVLRISGLDEAHEFACLIVASAIYAFLFLCLLEPRDRRALGSLFSRVPRLRRSEPIQSSIQ